MTNPDNAGVAMMVFLAGTFATTSFTIIWALSNRRPVRIHARLTGRSAAPYWHSPSGLQDERGIARWPIAAAASDAEPYRQPPLHRS